MKRFSTLLCLSIFTPQIGYAEGCDHGLSNLSKPFMATAIALRESGKYKSAISKLKTIPGNQPSSFCIHYEIGRNYLNLKKYDNALPELQAASKIAEVEDHQKQAIFNTIGYTWLAKKNYQQAVNSLKRQLDNDQFSKLPINKQTKVYNNIGLAYLRLAQFDNAKANFKKAQANGSKLATANLTVVDRLVSVQKKGIVTATGIYKLAK